MIYLIRFMMIFKNLNILAWNVCGVAGKENKLHMKEMMKKWKPSLLFLFEVHT